MTGLCWSPLARPSLSFRSLAFIPSPFLSLFLSSFILKWISNNIRSSLSILSFLISFFSKPTCQLVTEPITNSQLKLLIYFTNSSFQFHFCYSQKFSQKVASNFFLIQLKTLKYSHISTQTENSNQWIKQGLSTTYNSSGNTVNCELLSHSF